MNENQIILTSNNKGVSGMKVEYGFWYWFWLSYLILAYLFIPFVVVLILIVDDINWGLMIKIIWAPPFAIWYGSKKIKSIKINKQFEVDNDNATDDIKGSRTS